MFLMLLWVWVLVGSVIIFIIDRDSRIAEWALDCPIPFGIILVAMAWPIILWFWFMRRIK